MCMLCIQSAFDTVEGFWRIYSYIQHPSSVHNSNTTGLVWHIFRTGMQPLWEDEQNSRGGKWLLRIRPHKASSQLQHNNNDSNNNNIHHANTTHPDYTDRVWEDMLLAFIGDTYNLGNEVCGLVLTCKHNEHTLAVWNADSRERTNTRVKQLIRSVLDMSTITANTVLEYRPHDIAVKSLHHQSGDHHTSAHTRSYR